LAVVNIELPPLRERRGDIPLLSDHFLAKYKDEFQLSEISISKEAQELFLSYNWPGNVRELQHVIEGAINFLCEEKIITVFALPRYLMDNLHKQPKASTLPELVEELEYNKISEKYHEHNKNVTKTAESLGISRQNLQYKMKKHNIR